MIPSLKIPLQLQRQRQNRHNKLMNMVNSYQLTKQQKSKLQRIKSHTMLQINLRFIRSQINRNYKFPKLNNNQDQTHPLPSDMDQQGDNLLREQLQNCSNMEGKAKRPAQSFTYDLRVQNYQKLDKQTKLKQEILPQGHTKASNSKIVSLDQSRRVNSLGNQRSQQKDEFIVRRHNPIKNSKQRCARSPNVSQLKSTNSFKVMKPLSNKPSKQLLFMDQFLQRSPTKNESTKAFLVQSKKIKLPEINSCSGNSRSLRKLAPVNQKLKTQKIYQKQDVQFAIGKKLVTQSTDSGKKTIRGVEKYLKDLQSQKMSNNQPRLMKKQQNPDKRKLNIGLLKTTKNSIKGQIERQLC